MKPLRLPKNSILLLGLLLLALPASAATIDSAHKYAWSDQGGWVNFAPTNGGVTVADAGLTGYAWGSNTGWISFDTAQSGVSNDGQGNLGGFAWSEGEGWLSFTGVTIDSNGKFHGTATGSDSTLTFDCANCDVRTDWRAASAGSSGGSSRTRNTSTSDTTSPITTPTTPGTPTIPQDGPNGSAGSTTTPTTDFPNTDEPTASPSPGTLESQTTPTFPWPLVVGSLGFFFLLLFLLFRFFFRPRP